MKTIIGIDEVGRGPLAGPVSVCVLSCRFEVYKKLKRDKNLPKSGKDSKKLTALERDKYEKILKNLAIKKQIFYKITHISNKTIDSRGISFCIKRGINTGLMELKVNPKTSLVLLDGGLKAPKEFWKQKTIIKGDEKEKIIAWASILAKVSRDMLMRDFSKKYSSYGFDVHKGYGTAFHRQNIKLNGLSPIHRKSFCRNLVV